MSTQYTPASADDLETYYYSVYIRGNPTMPPFDALSEEQHDNVKWTFGYAWWKLTKWLRR